MGRWKMSFLVPVVDAVATSSKGSLQYDVQSSVSLPRRANTVLTASDVVRFDAVGCMLHDGCHGHQLPLLSESPSPEE